MTSAPINHVTNVGSQSASCWRRAPAAGVTTPSGSLQSATVDDLGNVFGRVGSQAAVGEPLAQLSDAELTAVSQCRRLGSVDVRMFTVLVVPGAKDRHGTCWQRTRTTSDTPCTSNTRRIVTISSQPQKLIEMGGIWNEKSVPAHL